LLKDGTTILSPPRGGCLKHGSSLAAIDPSRIVPLSRLQPAHQHHPKLHRFWRALVRPLLKDRSTPFYAFSLVPVRQALAELDRHFGHLPVRHWLSFKTQPLRPLLQWWQRDGRPIEVVSEFEFRAALAVGFAPERILINGPAKHRWLSAVARRGLLVNFDSPAEARQLAPLAKRLDWTCGVRLLTREEFDPESPDFATQFGLAPDEAVVAIQELKRANVRLETIHFHLRTNVASHAVYERALAHAEEICRAARFEPRFVDLGGGFPPPGVLTRSGKAVDAQFDLRAMAGLYERALKLFPSARELWLENGRWLLARSGVLVVKILDVKERPKVRALICDGGRTMNALVSNWEQHELLALPERRGPAVPTTVHGPTCMAFDQLARMPLPTALRAGDHLLWLDAGAYHLPWETAFSHGRAAVYWHDGRRTQLVRRPEQFRDWWGQWRGG
jgi:diaminopimelate decarboxylase